MPITKAAKKALRQGLRKKRGNLRKKRENKNLQHSFKLLVSQKKTKEAAELLPKIYKAFDKAAKTGVIKKNTASRKKSRLTNLLNKLSQEK